MTRVILRTAGAALTILLAGCGGGDDRTPGAVSPREAQALNDAAAMLDGNGQDDDPAAVDGNVAAPDNGQ